MSDPSKVTGSNNIHQTPENPQLPEKKGSLLSRTFTHINLKVHSGFQKGKTALTKSAESLQEIHKESRKAVKENSPATASKFRHEIAALSKTTVQLAKRLHQAALKHLSLNLGSKAKPASNENKKEAAQEDWTWDDSDLMEEPSTEGGREFPETAEGTIEKDRATLPEQRKEAPGKIAELKSTNGFTFQRIGYNTDAQMKAAEQCLKDGHTLIKGFKEFPGLYRYIQLESKDQKTYLFINSNGDQLEFPKQQGKEIAEQLDNLSKQTGTDKQKSECEQQILLGSKTAPHSEKLANYVQYWAQDICLTIPDSPGEYLMIDKEGTALRVSKGDIEEGIRMKEERQGEKKLSRQLFELEDLFLDPAQTNKGKELMIYNGYRLLDRSKETVLDGNLYLESEKNPSHYFVVDKKGSVNTVLKTDFERLKLEAEQKE